MKVGVIGCGVISEVHLHIIEENKDVELISICDIDQNKLNNLQQKHNCNTYTDYKKMIDQEQLDIVHICTPHFLHKEMIIYALENNVNVLCEKPVVMNLEEAEEVQTVLDKSNAKLGIVFQNRLNPTSFIMKKYVDEKILGNLKGIRAFITWFRDKEYYTESDWRGEYSTEGGGLLINQSIHTLDLIQWFGGELDWVSGSFHTRSLSDYIEVEDTSEVVIQFKNGTRGLFYGTNSYIDNSPIEFELLFDNGRLRLFHNSLYELKENEMKLLVKDESKEVVKNYYGVSHITLINKFYDAMKNNTEDYVNLKEATQVLHLIKGIRISNNTSKKHIY